jgi:hypothetical protein
MNQDVFIQSHVSPNYFIGASRYSERAFIIILLQQRLQVPNYRNLLCQTEERLIITSDIGRA